MCTDLHIYFVSFVPIINKLLTKLLCRENPWSLYPESFCIRQATFAHECSYWIIWVLGRNFLSPHYGTPYEKSLNHTPFESIEISFVASHVTRLQLACMDIRYCNQIIYRSFDLWIYTPRVYICSFFTDEWMHFVF